MPKLSASQWILGCVIWTFDIWFDFSYWWNYLEHAVGYISWCQFNDLRHWKLGRIFDGCHLRVVFMVYKNENMWPKQTSLGVNGAVTQPSTSWIPTSKTCHGVWWWYTTSVKCCCIAPHLAILTERDIDNESQILCVATFVSKLHVSKFNSVNLYHTMGDFACQNL